MSVRSYQFVVGAETPTLPTAGTPSASTDTVTKGYVEDHFVQGGAPVADITALKAIGSSDRADNDALWVDAENAFFVFDSASSTTGDDLTVVQPTSGTGRWFRSSRNPIIASNASFRNQAEARFYEQTGNGSNYIGVKAPDAVTSNLVFKLPNGDGTANQVLKTDGSAALGWASVATVEKTVNTTAISSNTTIGTSTADTRILSHTAAFDLTLDNTFAAGRELYLINEGTAEVSLKANNGSVIATIYRQTSYRVMARATSPATPSDWIGLTPIQSPWISVVSPTGSWTTNMTHAAKYRRVGPDLYVRHYIIGTGAIGTPGALTLTIPNSLTIDTGALNYTGAADREYFSDSGGSLDGNGSERYLCVATYSSTTAVAVYLHDDASGGLGRLALTHSVVPFSFTTNDKVFVNYRVPISGWSVNKG